MTGTALFFSAALPLVAACISAPDGATSVATDRGVHHHSSARPARASPAATKAQLKPAIPAASASAPQQRAKRAPAGATCYVGPRGGTYTITKSGRKNYGGC